MATEPQTYPVVLLIEHELSVADAAQIRSLHEGIEEQVIYHVLLPMEDAAARIEAAMGALAAGEVMVTPPVAMSDDDVQAMMRETRKRFDHELADTLEHLRAAGAEAIGTVVSEPAVDALAAKVNEVDGREAIILTQPHLVAEFFHVDWTSRARRKLGVPVLHLLEHETFDEQAGGGEGVTGV